jgi:chromosome segregation ATPase
MSLKKPSQLFQEEKVFVREDYNPIVETFNEVFDKFKGNVSLIEDIKQKVDILAEEIGDKITKSDLETAMYSHLIMVDENIKDIQSKVKGLNKNDLLEFKSTSSHLTKIVDDLTTNQFPKYKRKIIDTEVKISENFNQFKEEINDIQINAELELQEKLDNFANVVDNNFSIFNENIQKTKEYVNETVETYRKLYKIVESKTENENEKFEEYSSILQNFNEEFISFQESIQNQIKQYETINNVLDERFESFENDLVKWEDNVKNNIEDYKKETTDSILEFKTDISSLKADIVVFETHNKSVLTKVNSLQENIDEFQQDLNNFTDNILIIETVETKQKELKENLTETQKNLEVVERYIQNHYNDIDALKEEVYTEIKKLPVGNLQENIERLENKIDYIRETYSKIEPEVIIKQVIKEGFNEPPSTKNLDPLTPLDQNFVTLDQLQQHYRLFINRIQQQISTLGGGGETRLKYLDDIVGIATNASSYDGKYLKYNHTLGKFEFTTVDITNDSWEEGINGQYTNGNVGIGTSVANCELDVVGNVCISGVVTATDFNSLSDLKLKENVEIINSPIDTVMKIDGVNFSWKNSGKLSMGVIAQQLEETLPQLVSGDDIKTVNYNGLVGLLIEVVKDQQKQIGDLRKMINN